MDGPWSSFQAAPAAAPQQEEQGPWSAFNGESPEEGPWAHFQAQEPQQPASSFGGFNMATAKKAGTQAISSALNTVDEVVKQPAMAAGVVPMAIDALHSGMTGKPQDGAKDWWFKNVIDPIVQNQKTLQPDNSLESRVGAAVGGGVGMLGEAVATGGGSLEAQGIQKIPGMMEHLQTLATHGFKGMALPALQEATDTYDKVLQATGDKLQAARAAFSAFTTTEAQGVMPLSGEGKVLSRMGQAALSGTVGGEAQRQAMNTVLPPELQTQFDPVGTAIGAATMAPLGAFHNPGMQQDRPSANPRQGEDPTKLLQEGNKYEHQTPDVETADLLGSHIRNPYDVAGHVTEAEQGQEHTLGDQGTLFGKSEGVDTRKPVDDSIPYAPADKTPNLATDKNNPFQYESAVPYEHPGLEGKDTFPHNEGLQPEGKPIVGEHPGNDIPDTSNSGPKYDNGIDFEKRKPGDQESLPLDNPIEDRPGTKQGELFSSDELSNLEGGRSRVGESPITGEHHSMDSRVENSLPLDKHVRADGTVDHAGVLADIAVNGRNPWERGLAVSLNRFRNIFGDLNVTHVGDRFSGYSKKPDRIDGKLAYATAHYNPVEHSMTFGSKGFNSATYLHETVHALTSRPLHLVEMFLKHGIDTPTARQFLPYYRDLKTILDGARQAAKDTGMAGFAMEDHEFSKALDGKWYGLKNMHEMLSEAFSNLGFKNMMNQWGMYEPLKSLISKTFGIGKTPLDRVMDLGNKVADAHEASFSDIADDFKIAVPKLEEIIKKTNSLLNPQQEPAHTAVEKELGYDKKVEGITKGLPGGAELKTQFIPAAVDPAKIKAQIQAMPDIKDGTLQKVEANTTISAQGLATLWNSDGLASFARTWQRAHTLKDQVDKQLIEPLKRDLQKLIPQTDIKSWGRVMDVMHAEDFYKDGVNPNGKRLTEEQLKRALPNDKERAVYTRLRQEFDQSMQRTNDKLKQMGQDPMTAREAYTNSARHGPWSSAVYGPDGKMIGFIRGRTPQEVNAGLAWAKKQNPDWTGEKASYKKQVSIHGDDNLFQTYGNVTRALGKNDPLTQKLQNLLEERAKEMGMNYADYKKHMMDKTGMRFAEGDRPWLGQKRNVQEWFKNQLDVIQKSHEWAHMQDAVDHANKTLNDEDLARTHPNLMEHLREYTRGQLGFAKHDVASWAENAISHAMGTMMDKIPGLRNIPLDMKQQMSVVREAKGIMYMMTMGFWKPGHFIINGMLQPLFTAPRHIKLSQQGFDHNPLTTFLQGAHDSSTILLNHYLSPTGRSVPMTERQQRMADFIKQNGIAANNPLHDQGDIAESTAASAIHKGKSLAGLMMTEGERLCRVQAFSSFFNHLEQSGKFGDLTKDENFNELGDRAMRETTETMGSFRHDDRAAIFSKMGSTGTALATLKQFDINFFNQLQGYTKYAMQTKNFAPLLTFTALQLMMAGTMGFIGMQNIDDMWKFIRDMIPSRYVDKEFATFSPKQWMLENLNPMLSRGPVSAVSGINFASSLDAGSVVDPSLNGLFPFYSVVKDMVMPPLEYFQNPSADNLHKMVYNMTPYGSRGMLETGKIFGHDLPDAINTKSWFTSPGGQSMSPQNPGEGKYTRTEQDTNLRSAGFTSTREAMIKEADYTNQEDEKTLDERKQGIVKQLGSSIRNDDMSDAGDLIQKYIDLQGDPRDILSDQKMTDLVIKWNTDYKDRAAIALKSGDKLGSVYKYMNLSKTLDQVETYFNKEQQNYGPANAARQGR